MKRVLLMIVILLVTVICSGQDAEIKRIIEKMKSGQELTEAEEEKMDKWGEKMDKQENPYSKAATTTNAKATIQSNSTRNLCPKPLKSIPVIPALTRESYIALAKTLMAKYGAKTGAAFPELKQLLENTSKPSEGSDMGGLFMMTGSGLAEAEISGRISIEGGPEINTSVGLTLPEIPGL
jgi:hypothetical protein